MLLGSRQGKPVATRSSSAACNACCQVKVEAPPLLQSAPICPKVQCCQIRPVAWSLTSSPFTVNRLSGVVAVMAFTQVCEEAEDAIHSKNNIGINILIGSNLI